MGNSYEFEIWEPNTDENHYWLLRDDGMCWELDIENSECPEFLGNVYIPKGDLERNWRRMFASELPEHVQFWLTRFTTLNQSYKVAPR